jgi:hypothetical protein
MDATRGPPTKFPVYLIQNYLECDVRTWRRAPRSIIRFVACISRSHERHS